MGDGDGAFAATMATPVLFFLQCQEVKEINVNFMDDEFISFASFSINDDAKGAEANGEEEDEDDAYSKETKP